MPPYAYVDASALVTLVVEEPETAALQADIAGRAGLLCSALGATELLRVCGRALTHRQLGHVEDVLDAIYPIDVTPAILSDAAKLSPPDLRTLDAIHLATALSLHERDLAVITSDERLATAYREHGLTVVAP